MKVIFASANYWDSPIQVGDQHLARLFLSRGWQVCYLSTPISPLHLVRWGRPSFQNRLRNYRHGGEIDAVTACWHYVPGTLCAPYPAPFLNSEWVTDNWMRFTLPSLRKLLAQKGFEAVDLIHIRDPRYRTLLDLIPHQKSVFRLADNDAGFAGQTAAAHKAQRKLAQGVDMVVYTATTLRPVVEQLSPKRSWFLPNGVEFHRFAQASRQLPPEYEDIAAPIAVYVGSMDEWFDFELVNRAAAALPKIVFALIGPDELARKRLRSSPNVKILGRKSKEEVPRYLYNATVGIIPFDVANHARLVDYINPIKLYEYLACGLPVVATDWAELRALQSPAYLSQNATAFIENLRAVTECGRMERDTLVEFARSYDNAGRFEQFLAQLDLDLHRTS